MAFYNSGIKRMFKDSRASRTKNKINLQTQINTLKSNETSDDSRAGSMADTVATASNKITALENDKIYSQTFTDTFHRFFYSAALSTFQFPIEIPQSQMVKVVDFQIIIYNPEVAGMSPSYNVANNTHLIQLTRNSAEITASGAVFVNSQYGGPVARVCNKNVGPSAGPIYQGGSNGEHEDHRRTSDHLNHRKLNSGENLDTHMKICVSKDATSTILENALGGQTKIKILVRYRLMNYPELT